MAKFITLDNLRRFKKRCDDAYKVNITLDDTPTSDSENPVTSGGVKTYVDTAIRNAINEAIGDTSDLLGNTDDLEV